MNTPMKYFILSSLSTLAFLCAAPERPNFLWIISEDNSKHHLKVYEAGGAAMPHVQALAKEGIIFENACSNGAVCSVARSTLLTGCYAPRIGAQFHRKQKEVPMPTGLEPFPSYLKQAGYFTSNKRKTDYNVSVDMGKIWSSNKNWRARESGQAFFHKQTLASSHESSVHFGLKAMKNASLAERANNTKVPPHHPNTPLFQFTYASYQDKLEKLDQQIGEIIADLKDDRLYDDTIIFYFGDHGGVLPRSKGYVFETGIAPPLIIRIPPKWQHLSPWQAGTRTTDIVNFYDFGPSLLHAAEIPLPAGFDGKPFLGKDLDKQELKSRVAYAYADRFDEKYDLVRSYRKGNFKYHRNFQPFIPDGLHNFYRYRQLAYQELRDLHQQEKLDEKQQQFFEAKPAEALYNLELDPFETNNLALDPKHANQLTQMREELSQHLKQQNDLSLYPEHILIRDAFQNPSAFGNQHHNQISALIDIAQLQLLPYAEAQEKLHTALESNDWLTRYWACITATSFGEQAAKLTAKVKALAEHDDALMVRVRAAEFLARLGHHAKAKSSVEHAIRTSTDPVELNLILNSAAMLFEWDPQHYQFAEALANTRTSSMLIQERIEYLKHKPNH